MIEENKFFEIAHFLCFQDLAFKFPFSDIRLIIVQKFTCF
ncbi:unnamed protein product [Amoebophrya sp. A25]|nr:unnamed protein product [Amoebophrya sp. A25]|eukprot:GSA25T00023807001.1